MAPKRYHKKTHRYLENYLGESTDTIRKELVEVKKRLRSKEKPSQQGDDEQKDSTVTYQIIAAATVIIVISTVVHMVNKIS